MKFTLLIIVFFISCGQTVQNASTTVVTPEPAVVNETPYVTTVAQSFKLSLINREGECVLLYSPEKGESKDEKNMDIGMKAPCDFIRARWEKYAPQTVSSGKGKKKITFLIITGGTPHETIKDEFQPNGCGTYRAKIRVYVDKVELSWSSYSGPPGCPSQAMDEVMFLT